MKTEIEKRFKPNLEFRFWLYDPENDETFYYKSAADRDQEAENLIDSYFYDNAWSPDITDIFAGEITHVATEIYRIKRPQEIDENGFDDAGRYWDPDWEYVNDYTLLPLEKFL